MGGVRTVATIFGILGWFTLVAGLIGIVAMGSQISNALGPRGGGAAIGSVAASIVPLILLALGPFFLWALLTALCELHGQGERILAAVRGPKTRAFKGVAISESTEVGGGEGKTPTETPEWAPQPGQRMITIRDSERYAGQHHPTNPIRGNVRKGTHVVVQSTHKEWARVVTSYDDIGFFVALEDLEPEV